MTQTLEAMFYQGDDQRRLDYTPSGADMACGEIQHDAGITYICTDPEGIADGVLGACATDGVFKIKKEEGAGDTFSRGDKVAWDDTANQAEPDGGGNDDFTIGVCIEDAADGDDHVKTLINHTALT